MKRKAAVNTARQEVIRLRKLQSISRFAGSGTRNSGSSVPMPYGRGSGKLALLVLGRRLRAGLLFDLAQPLAHSRGVVGIRRELQILPELRGRAGVILPQHQDHSQ